MLKMKIFLIHFMISFVGSQVYGQVLETTPFPLALTSFTCHGRPPGYYADLETGCRTYHVCDGNSHFTYICPKRTLFQQRSRICDHSYLVRCEESPDFYEEENIYPDDEEEILIRLAESEENFQNKEISENEYNQTDEYIPTETTSLAIEEGTEILTTTRAPKAEISTQKDRAESVVINSKQDFTNQSVQKFIRFRLKDFRAFFYVPEFDNNSIVTNVEREFLLPLEKNDFMRFRYRKKTTDSLSLCPSHCNPKFFLPGFCHPCIMIK